METWCAKAAHPTNDRAGGGGAQSQQARSQPQHLLSCATSVCYWTLHSARKRHRGGAARNVKPSNWPIKPTVLHNSIHATP